MVDKDRDALERCMLKAREEPGRAEQLDSMLEDRPWGEVARFACYCVQGRALNLAPFQSPPEALSTDPMDERPHDRQGVTLLNRMLAAGLSRYEPDPLAALAKK